MKNYVISRNRNSIFIIIMLNVIIYILQQQNYEGFVYYFGLTPILVLEKLYIWQIFSYMFLHGNFWHIFMNMYALFLFGMPVEELWGTRRFLFYYFLTGVGAGLIIFIMNYLAGGMALVIPTIGASGAVFGLLLAFVILFPDIELLIFFFVPIKAKYLVVLYGLIELLSLISSGVGSSVSHVGHLGGIFVGLVYFLIAKRREFVFKAKTLAAEKSKPAIDATFSNIKSERDEEIQLLLKILRKLKISGHDSLSDDEYQHVKLQIIIAGDELVQCPDDIELMIEEGKCQKCYDYKRCILQEIKKYL